MYNSQTIAENIKTIAKSKGIQVKAMLMALNMATTTLQNMLKSMPKADTLAKIADYLDVSVDYLLGRQVSTPELSETESELLSLFRACPDADKENIILLARSFAEREQNASKKRKKSV